MNVRLKSTLIVVGTLLIGFVLGWFSAGVWHKNNREKRWEEMRPMRGGGGRFGMPNRIEQIIEPTEAQKDTISFILSKYHEIFIAKSAGNFDFVRTTIDSLIEELKPHLNDEQIEKLEERRHFFHPGPPGDLPPKEGDFQDKPFRRPPEGGWRKDGRFNNLRERPNPGQPEIPLSKPQ